VGQADPISEQLKSTCQHSESRVDEVMISTLEESDWGDEIHGFMLCVENFGKVRVTKIPVAGSKRLPDPKTGMTSLQ